MQKELSKQYNFKDVEERVYGAWLDAGLFHAEADAEKQPYTIVIPPPNVTGSLHMGHALDNTMQDILIRAKKLQGYNALWVPGSDHASISTEVRIIESLAKEGIKKEDLGREEFLRRAWAWKEEYGGVILNQLKRLGCACDWRRERFTMDPGLTDAVYEVFTRLYNEGLIYRGERLVNWCVNCETSISDAEVEHEEKDGALWHLCYKTDDGEPLAFATTRPETMLGDTALAVNPKDERYTRFVGQTVTIPVIGRRIPVIADSYVDMEYGTGIVKITPGHDPNDYEVGLRHGLPIINIMSDNGVMNENAGPYEGLSGIECRKRIVADFTERGHFIKKEAIRHAVGTHERCGCVIEPLVRMQWFVRMEPLAKPAIEAYEKGELNIVPSRFGKVYLNWLYNIKDWCISRQLWWGHRIPAYFCDACGEVTAAKSKPVACGKCGGVLRQDEDVLDTWFSSALWPFATLGWPENTPDLRHFYPTNVLVTGYDILFFWVIRMVFSGLKHTGELPFKDVLFHGIIRDAEGRKMSKSLGNGIDPLDIIDKYGADALRLSLIIGNTPGADSRFKDEKVEAARNFLNKIWNAARFILMYMDKQEQTATTAAAAQFPACTLTPEDKWIISLLNNLSKEVTACIDSYDLGLAAAKIYAFLWDEFCDWYIEMVKPRLNAGGEQANSAIAVLRYVFLSAMKLLHPFMPFITEEVYQAVLAQNESIMTPYWPFYDKARSFAAEENEIELIKHAVKSIRNIRAEMNVPPSKKIEAQIVSADKTVREVFAQSSDFCRALAGLSVLNVTDVFEGDENECASAVIEQAVVYLPLAGLIDRERELARLEKEHKKLSAEITRCEAKLASEGFVTKAPPAMLTAEKEKLARFGEMMTELEAQIKKLR